MVWIIILKGRDTWKYIKPESPCNKGEIRCSFHWFNISIGWQQGLEVAK